MIPIMEDSKSTFKVKRKRKLRDKLEFLKIKVDSFFVQERRGMGILMAINSLHR